MTIGAHGTAAAVGKVFLHQTRNGHHREMNELESRVLLFLLTASKEQLAPFIKEMREQDVSTKLLFKRLEWAGLLHGVDEPALIWLATIGNGVPGNLVLLCTVVAWWVED